MSKSSTFVMCPNCEVDSTVHCHDGVCTPAYCPYCGSDEISVA